MDSPETVVIGRVGKSHGLDGSFVVDNASEAPERFVGMTVAEAQRAVVDELGVPSPLNKAITALIRGIEASWEALVDSLEFGMQVARRTPRGKAAPRS